MRRTIKLELDREMIYNEFDAKRGKIGQITPITRL